MTPPPVIFIIQNWEMLVILKKKNILQLDELNKYFFTETWEVRQKKEIDKLENSKFVFFLFCFLASCIYIYHVTMFRYISVWMFWWKFNNRVVVVYTKRILSFIHFLSPKTIFFSYDGKLWKFERKNYIIVYSIQKFICLFV